MMQLKFVLAAWAPRCSRKAQLRGTDCRGVSACTVRQGRFELGAGAPSCWFATTAIFFTEQKTMAWA
jgi:hypothetical protein